MKSKCIQLTKFGYFYTYCLVIKNKKIKREISKLKEIIETTNNLTAINNSAYNKKIARKEKQIDNVLRLIIKKDNDFLIDFAKEYQKESGQTNIETDPQIIARNISQSFFDIYKTKPNQKNNIVTQKNKIKEKEKDLVLILTEKEQKELDKIENNDNILTTFLNELQKYNSKNINRKIKELSNILKINVSEINDEKTLNIIINKAYNNLDKIFLKGTNYPYRQKLIKTLSKINYRFKLDLKRISEFNNHFKDLIKEEILSDNNSNLFKNTNYTYEIPKDITADMIVKINEELEKEKYDLIEKNKKGQKINFTKPFSNKLQSKKIDMINSYFDERFECKLKSDSTEEEFVNFILERCELAEEITDDMFKKVLFDAHDSNNLTTIQAYEKIEPMRTLYNLYSPTEKLTKYDKVKMKFENIFQSLEVNKRDDIYKLAYDEKQNKHLSINELLPNREMIINDLIERETKFLESHAVEEFKYKASNGGKYMNYDLEIIARDIPKEKLPSIYQNLKRNITYTNFVEEIKPGEDRERKYKEARIVQRKTLKTAQEMIAKLIMNKSYDFEYELSYDEYQTILNDIYENILHEERIIHTFDEVYEETEALERNYQEKKKKWDEHSIFIKALYLVVSKKGNE